MSRILHTGIKISPKFTVNNIKGLTTKFMPVLKLKGSYFLRARLCKHQTGIPINGVRPYHWLNYSDI